MKSVTAALALVLAATVQADAQSTTKVGQIEVANGWARASTGRAGAAYFEIRNHGDLADRLVSARTDVSRKAQFHTGVMKDGIMRMERIDAIDVAAHASAVLEPGGRHVMLMGLRIPLKRGHSFALTLSFERSGIVTVDVAIMGPGARRGPQASAPGSAPR